MTLPDVAPVEKEIFDFFADRNFERSRRFSGGAYDPLVLRRFLARFADPQLRYETIHVAGTVGKGSITAYLARALRVMGYKTGAYFSPHFISLRERIELEGEYISEAALSSFWHELRASGDIRNLSFFDAMTALAFRFFAALGCEWAVIETGLGGRLDSTNNLKARVAVLTKIGLDHQNILGNSLEEITREKAGIIREGQTVYSVQQEPAVEAMLRAVCTEKGARLHVIVPRSEDYVGQNREFALAIIAGVFHPAQKQMAEIERSLEEPLFGRLTLLQKKPRVFFDGGHNAPAMRSLAAFVNSQTEPICNFFLNTMSERSLEQFKAELAAGTTKAVNFYFFPVSDINYHSQPPSGAGLHVLDDTGISRVIGTADQLNLFTGSMGIYKELRTRFLL